LPKQRQHALTQVCDLGVRPVAPKQIPAELALELSDRAGERGLNDVTLFGRPREIERPGHGEEVLDLMHFHARGTHGLLEGWLGNVRSVDLERLLQLYRRDAWHACLLAASLITKSRCFRPFPTSA
jgi:hypothetical protein